MKKDNATANTVLPRLAWGLKEAKCSTGLSVPLLRKEIREKRLRAKKAGRRVIILDSDLKEYLAAVDARN